MSNHSSHQASTMQKKRVAQKDVALAAGVDRSTVSLALRHHPGIPKETREHILKIAEKLGYAPDPALSALAAYRWPASSVRRSIVSIGVVYLRQQGENDLGTPPDAVYPGAVCQGAMRRAAALGFSASLFSLTDYNGNLKHLLRVMRNRGITGLILLPSVKPVSLDPTIDWKAFSVVAATTSILSPRFHQVLPNQIQSMVALLDKMHQMGRRRVGAIFSEQFDQRTVHAYSMAIAWYGHGGRILILPGEASQAERDRRIKAWLQRHKPDLAFVQNADGIARLTRLKDRTGIGSDLRLALPTTYIDLFPELIGETAVRVLSGMMYNNETGIPPNPQTTLIDGTIRETPLPLPRG